MRHAVIIIVALAACGPDDRANPNQRDTPGGAFQATCTATIDCGCYDSADDAFCERGESTQLQCLGFGAASKCSLDCERNSDCTEIFGAGVTCNAGMACQR